MSIKTLIEPTDLILEKFVKYYPYLRFIFSALLLWFAYSIITNLRESIRKLHQSNAFNFVLFLIEKYMDYCREQERKNLYFLERWWLAFGKFNRCYTEDELNKIKTEIIENRFDYIEYTKEKKHKMLYIRHACNGMLEMDNLNDGLLHSYVRHYDQWILYIPSLGKLAEKLEPFQQNFIQMKNAQNWQTVSAANEAFNQRLQQFEEAKFLEIKLTLIRAQLELYEFVRRNAKSDQYLGNFKYDGNYKFQFVHPTFGRQIFIISHVEFARAGPHDDRIKSVVILENEQNSQNGHQINEFEILASTSVFQSKTPKTIYHSQSTQTPNYNQKKAKRKSSRKKKIEKFIQ